MARPGLKRPPQHAVVVRVGDAPPSEHIPLARSSAPPPPPSEDLSPLVLPGPQKLPLVVELPLPPGVSTADASEKPRDGAGLEPAASTPVDSDTLGPESLSEQVTLRRPPTPLAPEATRRVSPPSPLAEQRAKTPAPAQLSHAAPRPWPLALETMRASETLPPPSDMSVVASVPPSSTQRSKRSRWAIALAAAAGLIFGLASVATTQRSEGPASAEPAAATSPTLASPAAAEPPNAPGTEAQTVRLSSEPPSPTPSSSAWPSAQPRMRVPAPSASGARRTIF